MRAYLFMSVVSAGYASAIAYFAYVFTLERALNIF